MTRLEALKELLAKVEAGDDPSWADAECCFIRHDTTLYPEHVDYLILAHRGSLDAAKALHDALRPDWRALVNIHAAWVDVWDPTDAATCNTPFRGEASDPARSWLIANIKAEIAQEGEA